MSRILATSVALILTKWVRIHMFTEVNRIFNRPTGRILRYLATNHFFTEVHPDTFAGNRISSVLDTGKSVATLQAERVCQNVSVPTKWLTISSAP